MIDYENASIEIKRNLAASEDTPADVLAELSDDSDEYILKLIASNPNTPIEVLLRLWIDFTEEIIANPVFSLLMLENPESNLIQLCLARSSTTSIEILEKLAVSNDSSVRAEVANNHNTPPECLLS